MEEDKKQAAVKIIEDLVSQMGFSATIELSDQEAGNETNEDLVFNLKTSDDSNILIGQYGINLLALQHIARLVVRKKTDDKINFVLDVNSYRQNKNQSLIDLARLTAEQAISEKRSIVMKPMTAYERRIVHIELTKDSRVATESIGENENRKIVVKPSSALQ